MPFNTLTVAAATFPTVVQTLLKHLSHPSAAPHGLSYAEGVALIRRFLEYASHHTVEQLQAFTAMYVPHPAWIGVEEVTVGEEWLEESAKMLVGTGLGKEVGGERWWRWRERDLKAEWVWMRAGWREGRRDAADGKVMLYVHGGAYYFGSVDEHRYQLQRHARKLGCKVFARKFAFSVLRGGRCCGGSTSCTVEWPSSLTASSSSLFFLHRRIPKANATLQLAIVSLHNSPFPAPFTMYLHHTFSFSPPMPHLPSSSPETPLGAAWFCPFSASSATPPCRSQLPRS